MALDDITKLMDAGKEKGYLAYGEMNDLIPHDVHSSEVLEDLLATIGTQGIDVLGGQPKLPSALQNPRSARPMCVGSVSAMGSGC